MGQSYEAFKIFEKILSMPEKILTEHPDYRGMLKRYAGLGLPMGCMTEVKKVLKKVCGFEKTIENQVAYDLLVPPCYTSKEDLLYWRNRFNRALDKYQKKPPSFKNPDLRIGITNFYLVYQGYNDKLLQKKTAALYKGVGKNYCRGLKSVKRQKIRIGFISSFFYRQSVAMFYLNMISTMPKDFEVSIFYLNPKKMDDYTRQIKSRADHFYRLPPNLKACKDAVLKRQLDILVYPEIGMDPILYFLAQNRLAPHQCVMMGHPVTSGIPTIDYYISSKLFETKNAQSHYTEKLLLVDGMPIHYPRPKVVRYLDVRKELGFSKKENLYFCPVTLFKIHPDFDHTIKEILKKDPLAKVLFIHYSKLEDSLKKRFKRTLKGYSKRVQFIPVLPFQKYLSFLAQVEVVLESFPFGGGNTTLQSFSVGAPVVTLETDYLRGRFTQAYYRLMEIEDCISQTPTQYAEIAVKLGTNAEFRERISRRIKKKRSILFKSREGVEDHFRLFREMLKS